MLLSGAARSRAQGIDGSSLDVSLLTVSPGPQFVSWMGHAALIVTNARTGQALEFDYGVVPPGFAGIRGILTGRLTAYAAEHDAREAERRFAAEGRSLRVQHLDLSPEQRIDVLLRLAADQRPATRAYRYDYRINNCTSRIRDLLDAVTAGALRRAGSQLAPTTLRAVGQREGARREFVTALFDLAMNNEIDRPVTRYEAAIFPDELAALVSQVTLPDSTGHLHPLTPARLDYPDSPPPSPTRPGWPLILGLALGGAILSAGVLARRGVPAGVVVLGLSTALVGAVLGILGLALAAAWLFTSYTFARHNANLLLLNPLLLVAVPLGLACARGSVTARRRLRRVIELTLFGAAIALVLHFTGHPAQDNWRVVALVLPVLIGSAAAFQASALD